MKQIIQNQRHFFNSNQTLDIHYRKLQLIHLYNQIQLFEPQILEALHLDLNKSYFESYETELLTVYQEIKYMLKHLDKLSAKQYKKTPLMLLPSSSYEVYQPYGCVLIIATWNYPFQLVMMPLIGAISAGNCCMIETSPYAPNTSKIIQKLLQVFNDEYIYVREGNEILTSTLLDEQFDYIFFTGSPTTGKKVYQKASMHLTPVTLELGGKSPCIVTKDANISLAAKRIVWGKLLNAGQTCVAPDYVLVHEDIKEELIHKMKKYIRLFYGKHPELNKEYPKIINEYHFNRLLKLADCTHNKQLLSIAPTIIEDATWDHTIMKEEIFGPILPIITYCDLDKVIHQIQSLPSSLALYAFSNNKQTIEKIMSQISFGGGCINDTIMHLANPNLSFGGVGQSGLGRYHGKQSFYTFSYCKSILKQSTRIDIPIRYAPYKKKLKIIRMLNKY